MNKTLKTIIIIVAVVLCIGLLVAGFFIYRHNNTYISKQDAIDIVIADASIDVNTITETDADFEKNAYSAYYEVSIDTFDLEYEYVIDAKSGNILSSDIDKQ